MKKCRCHLWGDKFWNDFFQPRHPGIFIILLDMVIAIAFTCIFVLLAIYIGALANSHADAYLIMFVSNLLVIVMGFLVIHFLTLHADDLTIIRCASLYLVQLLALVLGLTAIAKFHTEPTNGEMVKYLSNFFQGHNQVSRIMIRLQQGQKCCGIHGIQDYLLKDMVNISKVPDSCCIKMTRFCGNFRQGVNRTATTRAQIESSDKFFKKGCFGDKGFKELGEISMEARDILHWVMVAAYANPLIILIVFIIYSYYVCYKLPKEDDIPPWAEEDFMEKISTPFKQITSFQCFSQSHIRQELVDGTAQGESDFEKRHSMGPTLGSFTSVDTEGTTTASTNSVSASEPERVLRPSGSSAMDIGKAVDKPKVPDAPKAPTDAPNVTPKAPTDAPNVPTDAPKAPTETLRPSTAARKSTTAAPRTSIGNSKAPTDPPKKSE